MLYTYSIKKEVVLLTINRIIPDNHPNVFQFSFIILNSKNDSLIKTRIMQINLPIINDHREVIAKCIDINGKLKEAAKYRIYKPIPFREKSIITVRYNPQKATEEYWNNNKQINFSNKIYNKRLYSLKFFVKFSNCSIRFLTCVHGKN
jgi:hypothetical protein